MDNGCGKETRPPKYMLMTALEDEPEVVAQSQIINPALIASVAQAVIAGVSLFGTSVGRISQAINTSRNVSIEITNKSNNFILTNPRTYTTKGHCYHPPQPTIAKDVHQVCSFSKTANAARGSAGVLMYQILNKENKDVGELAIMFSVPFENIWSKNMFALGIYGANHPCDDKLFNEMYKRTGPFTRGAGTGNTITFPKIKPFSEMYHGASGPFSKGEYTGSVIQPSNEGPLVKGTMSAYGSSIIRVELWDK